MQEEEVVEENEDLEVESLVEEDGLPTFSGLDAEDLNDEDEDAADEDDPFDGMSSEVMMDGISC